MPEAYVPHLSLQQAIDSAGSATRLLWKPGAPPWRVPALKPEYAGWREEQAAWSQGVALYDLSRHVPHLLVEGPDATRLLTAISPNDPESFAVGQAKPFVPVTADGHVVADGLLIREAPERYVLSGPPPGLNWVRYQAERGGHEVSLTLDADSAGRGGGDPVLFRYRIQGPRAAELIERALGARLPKLRPFRSVPVSLAGATFRAFRHGMAGRSGYEFIGAWRDSDAVREVLTSAGKAVGLVQVGGLAYATSGIESGWFPAPTPGIYVAPELEGYRRFLSADSYEGTKPLHGSFFSDRIEDYYLSPYELGYARSIAFNDESVGHAALGKSRDAGIRSKVTLVFNADEVRDVFGANPGYLLSYGHYRVEAEAALAGMTWCTAWIDPVGTMLSLALLDRRWAAAGTQLTVVWGEHPGGGTATAAICGFARLRAIVQPSPYEETFRTQLRRNA